MKRLARTLVVCLWLPLFAIPLAGCSGVESEPVGVSAEGEEEYVSPGE